jgi:Mg-chelatase subunit ChlD
MEGSPVQHSAQVLALALVASSWLGACSGGAQADKSGSEVDAAGRGGAPQGSAGTGFISASDASISTTIDLQSDGGLSAEAACTGEVQESERLPLDIYFLVDTSGSMAEQVQGGSKWQVLSAALVAFLQDPANADIGAGIGYFPLSAPTTCTAGQDGCLCIPFINLCFSLAGGSCNVPEYAMPAVALSLPPNHAAVVTDIARHGPGGGTPTRPALEGAAQYASSWAQASGRKTVLVLATDGDPTGCMTNSPQDVANVAAAALAGPSRLQTFVVGVGRSLTSLDLIAQNGGTGQAILIDTGGDLGQAIADALKQIRGRALSCDFVIPARASQGAVDPRQVNVRYQAAGATTSMIVPMTFQGDPANCSLTGGWYYDDPTAPTTIKLCDATCQSIMGGRIDVEFGCKTVDATVR